MLAQFVHCRPSAGAGAFTIRRSSKDLNEFEDRQFDYVVTLCQSARDSCIAFPRDAHNLHWQCRDPSEAQGSASERMDA